MILFLLKKNFWDTWENLLNVFVANLGIVISLVLAFLSVGIVSSTNLLPENIAGVLSLGIFVLVSGLVMIPLFAYSQCAYKIADFRFVKLKDIFADIGKVWKTAFLFGIVISALLLFVFVGFPFYLKMGSTVGILLAAMVFWFAAVCILALQWFIPLYTQMPANFMKILKKCFIILFDNTNFSFFMFVYSLVIFVLSGILLFFVPGLSGILINYNNALRLRLYKYDWLEEHPEITGKQAKKMIPWKKLIAEDEEALGPRNIRNFLFPWK